MEPTPQSSGAMGLPTEATEILYAIRRRRWFIAFSTLVVGAAVAFGTMRQPKIYAASAQVLIEPVMPKVLGEGVGIDDLGQNLRREEVFYNTQRKTITSRVVMVDVIDRLGLAKDEDYLRAVGLTGQADERSIERAILDRTVVGPEPGSRIYAITVEDKDPDRAARIANAIGQAYIDYSLERRLESTRTASQWLDQRVTEFGNQLEVREEELNSFRQKNLLVSVSMEDRQNMTAASMSILNQKLLETKTQLISLRAEKRTIKEQRDRGDASSIGAIPRLMRNEVIAGLRTSLVELNQKMAELSIRYGGKHPSMVAVQKQVAETREALNREIDMTLSSLDNEIRTLELAESELEKEMSKEKQSALALNELGLEYSKLTRDVGTTSEMYRNLLKRHTEADLSGLLESNFVSWFQQAEPLRSPIRPSVTKNTAIGLVAGLLGLLVAIGGVLLDNTVHSRTDIEEFLKMPFLGVFPVLQELDAKRARSKPQPIVEGRDLYVLHNPKSGAAECARSIRTNLLFMSTDQPARRLLLTSARPGEGKTMTTVALGITMAQAGNRVIVIDTDLRKPRLHKAFGVSGKVGLTNVLVGTPLDDAIKSTELVGLDVLTCGPLPPNPAELLHSEKFESVLSELSERYDRVLLDSPPLGAVTDPAILSKIVDGTILVVQANGTPKEAVRRSMRQLEDVGAHVLGVVLNGFDIHAREYGHKGYYAYKEYGYGADAEDSVNA